jgi:RNA polymerase sigma-70 factor (ECF subfamily)
LDDEDTLIDEKNITDWNISPQRIAENDELKDILNEAINKLPPDYRVVFMLRDIQGFSTEETGKAINLSVPAVKSRLHRARAFLRNELNNTFSYGT